jgi:acetyl-CoA carboxylase carboxyl transferase subunit alpha
MPALEFEKPIVDLETRIEELKTYGSSSNVDMTEELALLEKRLERLRSETYDKLTRWQRVQLARAPGRPTALDFIGKIFTDFQELHGDRAYGEDSAIVGGLARLDGLAIVLIAQQKGRDTKENIARNFGMAHPEGFRKAMRLMDMADKFGLPLITLVDTPGAYPGIAAEERGQAWLIAQSIQKMTRLRVPVISVIIGEGGSGGALAIAVGNRVLILENAVYSVISPESCAAIVWRDAKEAAKAAEALRLTAKDLAQFSIVDEVIPEPKGGAHNDPVGSSEELKKALLNHLEQMKGMSHTELLDSRAERFRKLGVFEELA